MELEIEAKLQVNSHDAVRAKLADLRAQFVSSVLESNAIFDRPDGTLRAQGQGLRVRSCQVLSGQVPAPTITFKGPRLKSELKCREEIEIAVDDADKAIAILEALGFERILHFEKRRESWRLDDCRIELDEVPYLGCYVEIEGPDEPHVRHVQTAIGLGDRKPILDSYIGLLMRHCREQGLSTSRIVFESPADLSVNATGPDA